MSNITRLLSNVMDIPAANLDLLYSESRSKLVGTAVIVNGSLMWLTQLGHDYLEGNTNESSLRFYAVDVERIEVYLPQAGLYKVGSGKYSYLQKIAKRQWKKSFSWSYYNLANRYSDDDVFYLFGQSPSVMYQGSSGDVFYRSLKIGTKKGVCMVPSFQRELESFIKRTTNDT